MPSLCARRDLLQVEEAADVLGCLMKSRVYVCATEAADFNRKTWQKNCFTLSSRRSLDHILTIQAVVRAVKVAYCCNYVYVYIYSCNIERLASLRLIKYSNSSAKKSSFISKRLPFRHLTSLVLCRFLLQSPLLSCRQQNVFQVEKSWQLDLGYVLHLPGYY